jgi:hypothetical protein
LSLLILKGGELPLHIPEIILNYCAQADQHISVLDPDV